MKKISVLILAIGALLASCTQSEPDTIPVTGVILDQTSLTLTEGEKETLIATVSPKEATNKDVLWSTSNKKVATVEEGIVSAVGAGDAVITVTTDDGGKTATCSVNVKAAVVPVSSVALNYTELKLTEGDSQTLTATIAPDNATNKKVTWSSNNTGVATVNQTGVVTAVKAGTATIKVTTEDGGKVATCIVTVNAKVFPVTGVSVSPSSTSITIGGTTVLSAKVSPDNASDKTVSWSSSDNSIASVDNNGVVIAQAVGVATITVKSNSDNSKYAICAVTVEPIHVTSVAVTPTTLTLTEGDKGTVYATISPENATDKSLVWSSDNTSVASVDPSTGEVTAIKSGTAHVEAITKDGGKTASCTVTVNTRIYPVTGVELNKTNLSIRIGSTENLIATISPENATNKNVTWTSTAPEIASVNNDGLVSAKTVGTTYIKVTTSDGGYSASCKVTVEPISVTSVSLDKATAQLKAGESVTLTATVSPNDATDKTVAWSSSDATIASVTNGVVTANKVGTAVITAKAGDKTATCTITVIATPVSSVNLNKTSASLKAGESVTLVATVSPSDATDKTVVWNTSDASVATVSNGVVTAQNVGKATITAESGGKTASCIIDVIPTPVTSIVLDKTSVSMEVGETVSLVADVYPTNATDKTILWDSSNADVASVSNGIITALKIGSTVISAKAGDKTAMCNVSVKATEVTSISLNKTSLSLKIGDSVTLVATVSPSNATDKTITWETSNSNVAMVNNGVVSAINVGKATITAKAGNKTANCVIEISNDTDNSTEHTGEEDLF